MSTGTISSPHRESSRDEVSRSLRPFSASVTRPTPGVVGIQPALELGLGSRDLDDRSQTLSDDTQAASHATTYNFAIREASSYV